MNDFDDFINKVKSVADDASDSDYDDGEVMQRLKDLCAALEGIQYTTTMKELAWKSLHEYMSSLTQEKRNIILVRRLWIVVITFIAIVSGFVPILLSANPPDWFAELDNYFKAPVFLGSIAGFTFSFRALAIGVFRTSADLAETQGVPKRVEELVTALHSSTS